MKKFILGLLLLIMTVSGTQAIEYGELKSNWYFLGPISRTTVLANWRSQFELDYLTVIGGESNLKWDAAQSIQDSGRTLAWIPGYANESGIIELSQFYATESGLNVYYAYTVINADQDESVDIVYSCKEPLRAWWNGKVVIDDFNEGKEFKEKGKPVAIRLHKGANTLLLKVTQEKGEAPKIKIALRSPRTFANHVQSWLPYVLLILVWGIIGYYLDRKKKENPYAQERLVSLDALRGFDMFWITGGGWIFIMLAYKTGNYELLANLDHQNWNGFYFWDLIFPLFLFIVGCSIPFAFAKRLANKTPKSELYLHVFKRTLSLYIIGLLLSGGFNNAHFSDLRIVGVLPRIAMSYFFASIIYLNTDWLKQVYISIVVLIGYCLFMLYVPVPGIGAGNLAPDMNWANYIDLHFLPGSLYQGTWDNEGLLSSIPAVISCLLGALAGQWLRSGKTQNQKASGLFLAGISGIILGWLWGYWFPINKLLWSSSYVMLVGGWSAILLSVFYYIIDVKGYRKWAFFFVVIGANAITAYAVRPFIKFSEVANRLAGGNFAALFGDYKAVFISCVTYGLIWLGLYWLYKRKIFIKL